MTEGVTAAAAWVAALAAMGTLVTTLALLQRQVTKDRKAQASQVAAWIESKEGKDSGTLIVKNASAQPVYDVQVEFGKWRVDEAFPILAPQSETRRSVEFLKKKTDIAVADLVFTDHAGRRWRRDRKGRLRSVGWLDR